MQYINSTTKIQQTKESIVVLGTFDGLHRGHQKLFELANKKAKEYNLQVVALSFYPHPTWVLGNKPKPLILSRSQKRRKIEELGADVFIEYPFSKEFASTTPKYFFEKILVKQLVAKIIIVGENYCFGKDKTGDLAALEQLGHEYNVEICGLKTVKMDDFIISSTQVREFIATGKIEEANVLLGYPYTMVEMVVHGKKLGREIGYPTINMETSKERIYPPNGVYVTKVRVYNQQYMGITNVGYNPTVEGKEKVIETHILDFEGDLYGKEVEVSFYHFIRKEEKFSSLEALTRQLIEDEKRARFLLQMS